VSFLVVILKSNHLRIYGKSLGDKGNINPQMVRF
jgi:hypothetical protein